MPRPGPSKGYAYAQQRLDYRNAAWDLGCTCPVLAPHTHLIECPMYETPNQMAERLEDEHAEDAL